MGGKTSGEMSVDAWNDLGMRNKRRGKKAYIEDLTEDECRFIDSQRAVKERAC
jgi:hypothetical protein